ncbi:hypothetical protein [Streptomyces odonnellii]|uniref:hypothetical protein n=1 Tax=Streptomyces odonnellii TaxID=1417980 RepID=UPI000624FE5B|nr:hypothetical protein [Streptomyces odonnellii]
MTDTRKQLLADLIDDLAGERRAPQIAADYLVRHRALVLTEATNMIRTLPLDPAVMAMGGMAAQAYRRALNDAAAVLGKQADPVQERPEATHQGPSPYHGGLTTHRGTRETCSGPDCGPEIDRPTGQKYPCGLGMHCDTCGIEFRGDFIVTDTMTKAERLEIIRNHVRTTQNWECNATGDYCPNCKPKTTSPADELRQAANDLEALHTAAHGTTWRVARDQDTHPEGDGSYHAIGIEPTDCDADIIFQDPDISEEDAAYIAAMSPDLAQQIVELLRTEASVSAEIQQQSPDMTPDSLAAMSHGPLAIARKINNRPR